MTKEKYPKRRHGTKAHIKQRCGILQNRCNDAMQIIFIGTTNSHNCQHSAAIDIYSAERM